MKGNLVTPPRIGMATLLILFAASQWATPLAAGSDKDESSKDATTQTSISFPSVISATSLRRRPVIDQFGQRVGHLENVVIDLRHGFVALLEVDNRGDADADRRRYLLPPSLVDFRPDAHRIQLSVASKVLTPEDSQSARPQLADLSPDDLSNIYTKYEAAPYWTKAARNESQEIQIRLETVRKLRERQIRSAEWVQLGRVSDLAIVPEQEWRVAYVAVMDFPEADEPKHRLAIPLGAFALKTKSPAWLLDVEPASLTEVNSFTPPQWPTEIDRRWIEFVSVKYGRPVLDGVQQLRDNGDNEQLSQASE